MNARTACRRRLDPNQSLIALMFAVLDLGLPPGERRAPFVLQEQQAARPGQFLSVFAAPPVLFLNLQVSLNAPSARRARSVTRVLPNAPSALKAR